MGSGLVKGREGIGPLVRPGGWLAVVGRIVRGEGPDGGSELARMHPFGPSKADPRLGSAGQLAQGRPPPLGEITRSRSGQPGAPPPRSHRVPARPRRPPTSRT